ncbi:MAG: IS481 family transposase, partial [Proteobacteria bacterium]|nr:IS481 family transposase [Pseudomonadota bacterium]
MQHSQESLNVLAKQYGISHLPDVEGDKPAKKKFKNYPIGYFHIDIA